MQLHLILVTFKGLCEGHSDFEASKLQTLLLPKINIESYQTFSEFSSEWSSQKHSFVFLKFLVIDFSRFLFRFH